MQQQHVSKVSTAMFLAQLKPAWLAKERVKVGYEIELDEHRSLQSIPSSSADLSRSKSTIESLPDKITLFNTIKSILLFRQPGYSPSPEALQKFQADIEHRLKLKGNACRIGTSARKVISIHPSSIPDDISFDRMMMGATYPPLNKASFTTFLKNIDYNYENFRFWMLHEHYTKLFEAVSEEHRPALSPVWTKEDEEHAKKATSTQGAANRAAQFLLVPAGYPLNPPKSSCSYSSLGAISYRGIHYASPSISDSGNIEMGRNVSETDMDVIAPFAKMESLSSPSSEYGGYSNYTIPAGADLPISVQNLWKEVGHIVADYISPAGAYALNLSHNHRQMLIYALERSNHPSAMKLAFDCADGVLRNDSYPKFLQLATPNMNRSRQRFAYSMGFILVVLGTSFAVVMTLSCLSRAWRLLAIPMIVLGVSTLYAARHGMCLVLHSLGHYQVKPWEVFSDEEGERIKPEVFLGGSYKPECKDWVRRYNRRYTLRKIFDKEAPIQEPRIRDAQTVIFGQGIFAGLIASVIIVGFIMAIPGTNNF
ncbi:hypothetical protein QTJ16_003658 [Diplocarpon rosae]|uniref:RGS domain-containing protein n=1 Tax=Diplocarpon rosae TaxID=946125 RepID=A0AAD9SXR4_9HELO|nr:hypothetical protein QTJ16_003658 [Diplocarpon rosae]